LEKKELRKQAGFAQAIWGFDSLSRRQSLANNSEASKKNPF